MHELAICAIFKDESRDIGEWLEFHHGVGVSHFYLYDDDSQDDPGRILGPWISAGKVTLLAAAGRDQVTIYNACIAMFADAARWIAFLDIDEFLFSPVARDLRSVLAKYADHPAIFVHWLLFGSAGHIERPEAFVIDTFTACLGPSDAATEVFDHGADAEAPGYVTGWARDGKSIVDPRAVISMGAHLPRRLSWGALVDETGKPAVRRGGPRQFPCSILRINHYWSKSLAELAAKVKRGSIYNRGRPARSLEQFLRREALLNSAHDETILPLWQEIKRERLSSRSTVDSSQTRLTNQLRLGSSHPAPHRR